ncbi:MAG: Glycine-rich cell wall structural protein precursor match [Conexibacter sp.]|nr:Glycine-rich cell wall structural protein precursor match [Conexibacter sp.]
MVRPKTEDMKTPLALTAARAAKARWARMCVVGLAGALALAASGAAQARTGYVADYFNGNVTPFGLATHVPGSPIPVGWQAFALAITPDGATAYVAGHANSVTPIDLATDTAGPAIPVGSSPFGIAITPDGTTAYVTNNGANTVTPIDLATDTAGPAIAVDSGPYGIAITPDGTTAYVTNNGANTVTPIDLATHIAGAAIPASGPPLAIAISPDGTTAYVTLQGADSMTPIDIATNTTGSPISVGLLPNGVAIVPNRGPAATFGAPTVAAGSATRFDAAASSDPDGTVADHVWYFGDGTTTSDRGAGPRHAYAHAGTYTATLTVTDDEGCSTTYVFTGQTASCTGTSAARTTRQVTVTKAAPTLLAASAGDAALGGSIHATATLAGGHDPTGQVAFALHAPEDADCSGTPVATTTVVVSGDATYPSAAQTPTVAGTYHWTASYSGDADNQVAAAACGAAVTVSSPALHAPALVLHAPALVLHAPAVVIAARSFTTTCHASAGALRSCRVEAHPRGTGRTRSQPLATGRATRATGARSLKVTLHLTGAGRRALAGALGGMRVTLRAAGATDHSGTLRTERALRLLAPAHHLAPPGAMFVADATKLTPAGHRFLADVRARARYVGSVRCTGHTAAIRDGQGGSALSLARARVACHILRGLGPHVRHETVGVGNRRPRASNDTEAGRARNRYVELTITHHR